MYMCHGLQLKCRYQPYKDALCLPKNIVARDLEYFKKYSVSKPV